MVPQYTQDEIESLAPRVYAKRAVRCPRCQGPVRTHFLGIVGRATEPVTLNCERCRAHGEYDPTHLEEMRLEWSREQKLLIIERYWAYRTARCPNDDSVLTIDKSQESGQPPYLLISCPLCGRHFDSLSLESEPEPGSFAARYEECGVIAKGGMGQVVLVRERSTGLKFAAKKILPQFLNDIDAVKRFGRETRILEQLAHPNIVPIKESFIDDKGGLLVMHYLEGGTLSLAINDQHFSCEKLVSIFEDAVRGVAFLHQRGVIHRDLKPDNILLDLLGQGHVSDFGLARLVIRDSTALTQRGTFLGTHLYAPPEQLADSSEADPWFDIHALGLIAYEIATRKSPYARPVNALRLQPALASALEAVLSSEPADRPRDGTLLVEALKAHFAATA